MPRWMPLDNITMHQVGIFINIKIGDKGLT